MSSFLCSCLIALSLLAAHPAPAAATPASADSWGSWSEAKTLYDAGKFEEALHALRSHPDEGASYFYNLATVHLRLAQYGLAVAYLEKANRLRPHDPDVLHNLSLARAALVRLIGKERLDPASNWLETTLGEAPLTPARGLLGALALLMTLLVARSYRKTGRARQALLSTQGLTALAAFALASGLLITQKVIESHPPATAIEPVAVRSGPGETYLELGRVEAGSRVRLLGQTAQDPKQQALWRQVRYSHSAVGWVPASSLLLL